MMRVAALALTLAAVAVAGCRSHYTFACDNDMQCIRDGNRGYCTPSPVDDKKYCVFPDLFCPSFRWDQTAPSAIAGVCVGEEKLDMGAGGGGGPNDLAAPVTPSDFAFAGDASINTAGCSTTVTLYGVWGASTDDIWVVGQQNTVFHYHAAMSCEPQTVAGTPKDLRAVWGRSANEVYIVGEGGVIVRSTDRGASWPAATGQSASSGFWGIGGTAGKLYAAVENVNSTAGGELWTATTGTSWTKIAGVPADGNPLDQVWSNGTRVWVAGGGNIYYSDDGTSWPVAMNGSGVPGYWAGLAGTSTTKLVGVTTGAVIFYYDGGNWSSPLDHRSGGACSGGFYGLGTAPGRALAVGKYGCIAYSSDGGATWKAYDSSSGSPYTADFNGAWIDDVSNRMMVVGTNGTIIVDPMLPP